MEEGQDWLSIGARKKWKLELATYSYRYMKERRFGIAFPSVHERKLDWDWLSTSL